MRRLLCALGFLSLTALRAEAQYFGRNQVQYQSFNFQILRTEHFDIYFYPQERDGVEMAARMAERWHARLTSVLGHELRGRQPLILYAAHAHFQQTNALGGGVGEGTGGVTESFKRRIVLPFTVSLQETDHVIGHELAHAFQFDISGRGRSSTPGVLALPLWFVEGMAEYLSVGPVDAQTAMWLRDALAHDKLPKISDLDDPRYFPYRYGHALWAFVGGRYGDEAVGRVLRAAARGGDPVSALQSVLAIDIDTLSAQWHDAMREQWGPMREGTQAASELAAPVLTKAITGGELNIAPALSPDGSRVAFLSERDLFSIDLYVADAQTGRVQRKITSTAVDGHLESIQFINSAGSWHPDGRQFVLGATIRGRPALQIVDMDRGSTVDEIRFTELDDILNPSYSPDGGQVVFSAQSGGVTDLFIYDLGTRQLRRLTNDAFADLQPVWSPDGRTIAFVTDRFGTNLQRLDYGAMRLGLADVASGRISAAPGFTRGKHINPQWGAEGRALYFLADPDGVTNVYRLEVASGQLTRVTNLFTGITGISSLSPAMTVATTGDQLMFSVQQDNHHEVYRIDGVSRQAGTAPAADQAQRAERAVSLPPSANNRLPSHIAAYLGDAGAGLPPADSFEIRRYRPTFGLDYVAQPSLAVGADRFGTYVGGGAALFWSSMLGDRQLATMLQVNGGFKDIAAQVAYINLRNRIDWAISAGQQPYIFGGYNVEAGTFQGAQAIREQQIIFRQINRQAGIQFAYPFNRVRRVELQTGVRHISFNQEIREVIYDPNTGQIFQESRRDSSIADGIFMGELSSALVFDNSIFGGTGPVIGGRYRLEANPVVGTLNYVGALADLRKYFMPLRPITFATRLLHYGRYGSGAEDNRLSPLYVGYQGLVRGYDNNSFSAAECADSTCTVFSQLIGSRILVGNAEVRLPLMGPLGVLTRNFLPVDLAFFGDAGVAWQDGDSPRIFGGSRNIVTSVGVGLRINLFGYFIGEIDVVRPLDRPSKGWYVQMGLNPGF